MRDNVEKILKYWNETVVHKNDGTRLHNVFTTKLDLDNYTLYLLRDGENIQIFRTSTNKGSPKQLEEHLYELLYTELIYPALEKYRLL